MSKKDDALKCAIQTLKPWHNREIKTLLDFSGAIKVCEEALEEKEWQGLTEDERYEILKESYGGITTNDRAWIIKAIEQKLKEKNHGTT